jgi:hypothetical protein
LRFPSDDEGDIDDGKKQAGRRWDCKVGSRKVILA